MKKIIMKAALIGVGVLAALGSIGVVLIYNRVGPEINGEAEVREKLYKIYPPKR